MSEERAMTLQEFCEFKRKEIACFEEDMKSIIDDYNKPHNIEYWEEFFEEEMKLYYGAPFLRYAKLLIEYGLNKHQK